MALSLLLRSPIRLQAFSRCSQSLARSCLQSSACRKPVSAELSQRCLLSGLKSNPTLLQKVSSFAAVPARKMSSDHTKLWVAERALSVALLGLIPAALLYPCKPLDALMAVCIVMHTHWGLEAIVVDYIRPVNFGPVIPKVSVFTLYALSVMTLAGLFMIIGRDVGVANSVRQLWSIKSGGKKSENQAQKSERNLQ